MGESNAPLTHMLDEQEEGGEEDREGEEEAEGETPAQPDYTQRVRQARRASEMWAYYMLCEEGDMMRQPCTVPLVDTIPFTLREKVVRAYARCITVTAAPNDAAALSISHCVSS